MSDRSLLVFVHINKTAGTTLRQILRSSYGARHADVEPWHGPWEDPPFSTPDLHRVRRLYPRLASVAGHRVTGFTELEEPGTEMRYVTFLREPISMCASRFQYQLDYRKKERVFEDWIRNDWVRDAQTQRIGGTTSAADAIATIEKRQMFVGLTERFDESMVLLRALRAPDLNIRYERANVAKSSKIAKELLSDPVTRRMIEEANQADLELYDHVVRELYPSFQRDYGDGLEAAVEGFVGGPQGFSRRRLAAYGLKQRLVHRPALRLYRSGWGGGLARRLLG